MQLFRREHVNWYQTLLISGRNQFHTTLPLIRDIRSRKRLVLVRSELLGQFVNSLTADYKCSRRIERIYRNKFQGRYLRKQIFFLDFFLRF